LSDKEKQVQLSRYRLKQAKESTDEAEGKENSPGIKAH